MSRSLQGHLEEEADRKGLTGEAKKQYVGGAWNRIRGKDERSRWRHSRESELLSKHFGTIHEMREYKDPRQGVVFRQGGTWYHMPRAEYHTLVDAAERDERDKEWAQALIQREREQDARRKATEQQKQEREAQRQARAQRLAEEQAQRELQRFERVQYGEVVSILKRSGGIQPFKKLAATGKGYMRDEYEALPSTVRSAKGRLDMDEAAAAIHEEIPWLKIETPDDLVQYFERHRDYRRHHGRLADLWWRPAV
jgi:hypothetical protein